MELVGNITVDLSGVIYHFRFALDNKNARYKMEIEDAYFTLEDEAIDLSELTVINNVLPNFVLNSIMNILTNI